MVRITCYMRPHRLEAVKTAVADVGITGMSVSDVRGRGSSPERAVVFAGHELHVSLPMKSKLVVVVDDDLREEVIQAMIANARTGEEGDGKIFVEPIIDAIRIRTLERGPAGL